MGYAQRNIYDIKYGRAMLVWDKDCWRVESSDGGFADSTGYSGDEMINANICDIVPEKDAAAFADKITSAAGEGKSAVFEASLVVKSGHTKRFLFYARGCDEGVALMVTQHDYAQRSGLPFEDITAMFSVMGAERVKEEIDLFLSECDDKTKEHYLLIIDMDNYGKFLNSYGRQFVGTVLKNISAGIVRVFENKDVIMGRLAEDVTAVLLKDSDIETTLGYCERVRELFAKTYTGAREYGMEASCKIGVAKAFKDGGEFSELSLKAQMALDEAKTKHEAISVYSENTEVSLLFKELSFDGFESVDSDGYERGFVAFASSLIAHSRNLDCSINLLLECIGRNFTFDTVLINEYDSERKIMRISNYWNKTNGVSKAEFEESDYTQWEDFMSSFDREGFMFVEDTSKVESEKDREFLKILGVTSCVNCMLYDSSRMLGYMSFCVNDENRKWSKTELVTLLEVSKLVAMAVALRKGNKDYTRLMEKDDVTGLLAYRSFIKYAQNTVSDSEPNSRYAVIYADINNFAYVNDNFGFFEGNRLLSIAGERLNTIKDAICCRTGADRFVCVVPVTTTEEDIIDELARVFKELDDEFLKRFPMSDLSMVAGISYLTSGIDDVITIIENANSTRKVFKEDNAAGKIGIYTPELRRKREHETKIIGTVHKAIENGDIIAYLQPKVSLSERKVIGAEALVRWKREDGTIRYPGDFIPTLEKVGYIVDVDFCVYEQALKILVEWKKNGYELIPISVNFSRQHLKYEGFEDKIRELAQKYDIDPGYIEIEVTESMVASDVMAAIKSLGKLRDFGFKVDIDDFGTGYSSLNTLVETPADIVKIDKCFVDKTDTEAGRNYTKRIAEVAVASNKEPVFEGVETEDQAAFLLENGYDVVQGYLFSKPIPVEEFENKYMK